jgi:molecular chaperone DnaK (HSP70)
MQGELVELMKHECDKKIQELEKDLLKIDNERKDNLKKASNDVQKTIAIEKEYKLKMEELNRQLQDFKDKERK